MNLKAKLKPLLPFAAIALVLLLGYWLWSNASEEQYTSAYSSNGVWDLRDFDFADNVANIRGRVEYIPAAFLTPEEFAAREGEASHAFPGIRNEAATIRIRLLVPDDQYYVITRISTGFADRIYVNGQWLHDVGRFEEATADSGTLFTLNYTFTAWPVNGVIEIVHQQSNFIYRVRSGGQGGLLDEYAHSFANHRAEQTSIMTLGILLTLAIVSLLLYLLLLNYRPAILFSLLCLLWFFYTSVTGSMIFVSLMPLWLSDPLNLRILAFGTPATTLLIIAITQDMFPGLLHRYFVRAASVVYCAWIIYFIFANPDAILGTAFAVSNALAMVGIVISIVSVARKLPQSDMPQAIFIIGTLVMGYTGLRLTLMNLGIVQLPPFGEASLQSAGIVVFFFLIAASIFLIVMRETEKIKETQQRLAADNAALDNLSRMKTKFLANMSHEVKTPLTVILSDVQRVNGELVKHGLKNERIIESTNRMQEEIMRLSRLTENALKMSALQESHEKMNVLDTAALFRTGAEGYQGIVGKQGNTLSIRVEKNLPRIYGNSDQLIGVLSNLIINANNHTRGGEICVDIKSDAAVISVTVSDTGTGIPPEILPQVFSRGVSGSGGTGMGLPICKNIVESHGGTISIESQSGKGTAVTFTAPIYDERAASEYE